MNNNQDNINNQSINNPQNINPNTYNNYPNGMQQQPMLNVIPGMQQNVNDQQIQNESFQNQNIHLLLEHPFYHFRLSDMA